MAGDKERTGAEKMEKRGKVTQVLVAVKSSAPSLTDSEARKLAVNRGLLEAYSYVGFVMYVVTEAGLSLISETR